MTPDYPDNAGNGQGGAAGNGTPLAAVARRIKKLENELKEAREALNRTGGGKQKKQWEFTPQSSEEEESWLTTYLDVMTLLLVMLVVMLAFAGNGVVDAIRERTGTNLPSGAGFLLADPGLSPLGLMARTDADAPDPLEGLPLDQLGKDIDVIVNEQTVSFRINSEILFSSGQADLSLEGLSVLKQLIKVLQASKHEITVAGHTDSVPIRSVRFPSNWELSGSRAGSVVRYLEANGIASNRLRAVGYADTKPIAENSSAEGRASNRRVELILETPKPDATTSGSSNPGGTTN